MLFFKNLNKDELLKSKSRLYWTGGLMLVVGILALCMPLAASFAIELLVGWLLIFAAIAQGYGAYKGFRDGTGGWWDLIAAICALIAGILFITKPLAGVLTLSLLLSAYFLVEGVLEIVRFWDFRNMKGALWILISGIISLVLAWMMWSNMAAGMMMIGIVLGVDFIFSGMSLIFLGRGCAQAAEGKGPESNA